MTFNFKDTIVAISTAKGSGAIAVIRLSGHDAIAIASNLFHSKKGKIFDSNQFKSKSVLFGVIKDKETIIDEVLMTVFVAPHSYTGENCIEVSCHGSPYIQQKLLQLFLRTGARMAEPGEFTLRAFLNQKFDLSQAEAVADLIASDSAVSHQMAITQMRGGYSQKIKLLRNDLINFASLIELELDFSEEDVEFANREQLSALLNKLVELIQNLLKSFEIGNVLKNGVPVSIVGKPNAGKSTLLNALLEEERAIVSEIAGTTRDTIEDDLNINGILFRFIDTAGLRNTQDSIEQIGINRAIESIRKAFVVIYLFDVNELNQQELNDEVQQIQNYNPQAKLLIVANKIDQADASIFSDSFAKSDIVGISAKNHLHIDTLKNKLHLLFESSNLEVPDTIVTNARHAQALNLAAQNLLLVQQGIKDGLSGELLAQHIRQAIQELGQITGEVSSNDLLENIFSRFCIGK